MRAELVDGAGTVKWSALMPARLGELHGGGVSQALSGSWRLPSLASGTYSLRLVARDARTPALAGEARLPLKWTVNERAADGGLTLRTLQRR